MSRFFSEKYASLVPYTPGEQPKEMNYIKLNTNESPFPPSPKAVEYAKAEAERLQLYSDPECRDLVKTASDYFGVSENEMLFTNGSDEILNFAFMAFCDGAHSAAFPDITYGFYPVFAELNGVPFEEIPLKDDFTVDVNAFCGVNKTVFIANPNAPTGIALSLADIEKIIKSNPDNIVVIDEAYVDFGAESAISLIHKYDNLLVTGTFSKSRSLAGGRLGFGIANEALIKDLNTVKYSTNPYNVNRMTMAAGVGVIEDNEYFVNNCREIQNVREYASEELQKMGFELTSSSANFIFAASKNIDGETLYLKLKEKGILIRHFDKERIKNYNRITVGTKEQMDLLLGAIKDINEEIV